MCVFSIKTKEYFVNVSLTNEAKKMPNQVETSTNTPEKNPINVRILLKANNYTSIYHSDIKLEAESLHIYYGKNYKKKISCKNTQIKKNSKYFKNCKVIKVEGKKIINWKNSEGFSRYNGIFYIYCASSGLVLVNELNLEDYIASVVASEIGGNSPLEALKAQAICARTYIMNCRNNKYKEYNAVADDSTSYQVYNRLEINENCVKAANLTKNLVIKYKNNLINACYFSTSCGYTTDYKIWGKKKLKYLKGCCGLSDEKVIGDNENEFEKFIKSKPKAYEAEYPFYRWSVNMSEEQLINSIFRETGTNVGNIKKIEINKRGAGGIVAQMTIYGDKHQLIISNQNQIRKLLCSYYAIFELNDGTTRGKMNMLPSAFIFIERIYESGKPCGFKIYGGGFGHGSGMSQNGAKEMANEGMSYDEILKKYYSGIEIAPL